MKLHFMRIFVIFCCCEFHNTERFLLIPGSSPSQISSSKDTKAVVTIQTEQNTVDVRGQRSDEALSHVEDGLSSVDASSALFIVHGMGTGKLRSEIHQFLGRNPLVAKFSLEKESSGGCTIVYLK